MEKRYNPKNIEDRWYKFWLDNNLFSPKGEGVKFSIAIPPPNVTGILHIGHCLNTSIQDVFVRFKRMKGFDTLWIPGLDHSGISTQQKVVQKLEAEGKNLEDISKEEFLNEAWQWKDTYGKKILSQFKKLGLSLDWSRERFTLDEGYKKAVKKVFLDLYEKGLIYKGEYMINWSTECKTALSDDEVEHKEVERDIWNISYKLENGEELIIATTRPETIFGDAAVAVHPEDERYKHLIGKKAIIPIINKKIPIITDEYVKKDFGTGVLKVTPAHDPNDFEIGKRHNLEAINILDKNLKLNVVYEGATIAEAREKTLKALEELGQLKGKKKVKSPVGHCIKSNTPIESLVSKQWFVKMKPLATKALDAVKNGEIEMKPAHWKKTYYHWLENIQDWCISRQLWWGHDIPIEGEEDVLDTWFSSALWPFATLGWPENSKDLEKYFPTDMVVTGGDIIFFWIARMIMTSYYFLDKRPFDKVIFHGIVRDEKGRKMSKSLGNSPDPLNIIDKYGADALRFALLYNNNMGNDLFYSEEWVEMGRNFCNKLWNTFRFISMNLKNNEEKEYDHFDKWILSQLNEAIDAYEKNIENANLDIALKRVYSFFWNDFADWYIEICKKDMEGRTRTLRYVLNVVLKLLHPFIPFLTEEIYSLLKAENYSSISISSFPEKVSVAKTSLEDFKTIARAIRNIRKELNISNKEQIEVEVKRLGNEKLEKNFLEQFTNSIITEVSTFENRGIVRVEENLEISFAINQNINLDSEKLKSDLEKFKKEYERIERKLSDEKFISKAPEKIIEREKKILKEFEEKIKATEEKLSLTK